jgi:hypothetical protein
VPLPTLRDNRPAPKADWLPDETLTSIAPDGDTRPDMAIGSPPALRT